MSLNPGDVNPLQPNAPRQSSVPSRAVARPQSYVAPSTFASQVPPQVYAGIARAAYDYMGSIRLPDFWAGVDPAEPQVSSDIRAEEDFSDTAELQRTMDEVEYDSTQEYYTRFPFDPTRRPSAREGANILRLQRANALKLIATRRPETLEQYPSIREALATSEDFTEEDARRLINIVELDAAFEAVMATNDPVAQQNIVASMPVIQRAAFLDFIPAKLEELKAQAEADPSWASTAWNAFFSGVVEPTFNALLAANEFGQQVLRSYLYAAQERDPVAALAAVSPVTAAAATSRMYWDDVAVGSYDQEALAGLREEYGTEVVDALLLRDEFLRDGQPDPYGRWVAEMADRGMGDFARLMTDRSADNEEFLALARQVNAAHLGNTGMLFLNPLPSDWKSSEAFDFAAGASNVAATFLVDPTIIGAKAVNIFRGARYGLIKITGARGVSDAFRYRRGKLYLNNLGRQFEAVRRMENPGRQAVARDVIARQHRSSLPDDVIDDMYKAGVANADDAHRYFVSKQVTEEILSGRTGPVHLFNTFVDEAGNSSLVFRASDDAPLSGTVLQTRPTRTLGERLLSETQLARRTPLLPGRTMAGVLRTRMRLWLSTHNLINRRFANDFIERFGDEGLLTPSIVGQRLVAEAEQYGALQGVSPRLGGQATQLRNDISEALNSGKITQDEADILWSDAVASGVRDGRLSELLRRSSEFGFQYTNRSMSARLDRVARRFAKAPFGLTVKLTDGSDARKIYNYARVFVSRQDAALIAQVWRDAPDIATRRLIRNGLVQTAAAARGVQFRGRTLESFLPEAARGGVYSPTLITRQTDDGSFVPVSFADDPVDGQMALPFGAAGEATPRMPNIPSFTDDADIPGVMLAGSRLTPENAGTVGERMAARDLADMEAINGGRAIADLDAGGLARLQDELAEARATEMRQIYPDIPEFLDNAILGPGNTRKVNPEYARLYLARYYPDVNENDTVRLYRGLTSNDRLAGDPADFFANWAGDGAAHWSSNPAVALGFSKGVRENQTLAYVDVPVRDIIEAPYVSNNLAGFGGRSAANWQNTEAAVFLNYSQVPDYVQASLNFVDSASIALLRATPGTSISPTMGFYLRHSALEGQAPVLATGAAVTRETLNKYGVTGNSLPKYVDGTAQENADFLLPRNADGTRSVNPVVYTSDPIVTSQTELSRRAALINSLNRLQAEENVALVRFGDEVSDVTAGPTGSPLPALETQIASRPSNFNGREHALHLWQTTDYAALPDFTILEEAGTRVSLFDAAFGVTHSGIAQGLVDLWSLGTLAGPRYYMRNAIEDYLFYAMTAGNWGALYKGRRFSTAQRRASGIQVGRGVLPGLTGAKKTLPYPQKQLGMVNKVVYGTNKVELDGDNPVLSTVAGIVRNGFTDAEKVAAMNAMRNGDMTLMRNLIAQSMARQKLPGYTAIEEEYLLDFVSEHGEKLLAEVIEATRYGVSASLPDIGRGANLLDDAVPNPANLGLTGDDGIFNARVTFPGEWGDIPLAGDNPFRYTYWQSGILGATERDGVIGKLTVGMLDRTDDEIVPVIARAIDEDTVFRYKERMAAMAEDGVSSTEFARRYVRDVRNLFARPDGTLNRELWEKVAVLDSDGNRVVRGSVDGNPVVTVDDLKKVPVANRPVNVLGRNRTSIPTATSIKAFDKMWAWMGDQYARVAREPIFFANYLEARRMLVPLERQLTEQVGEVAARKRLSQIATDRAYGLTLSYTDNPANRTLLAWNVRNVARFYRAAEDFTRRMMRIGKNYPEGIWKIGLTYDVLNDTGFVYTDENNEKYFVFPGSAQLIDVMQTALSGMGVNTLQLDPGSYEMRGYVRMIAPSTDAQQWIPTLSSPLSAFPMKVLFDTFPSLRSFEQAVLGEYSEGAEVWKSLVPSHVVRVLSLIDDDERHSSYAAAMKDAIQVSAAAGIMPSATATDAEKRAYQNQLDSLVRTMLTMRMIGGFTLFTAPRITANDVTEFAREGGALNMDSLWRSMIQVEAEKGSANPFGDAIVKWVETFGTEKLPYTLSTYESEDEFGGLAGLTSVQATKEGEQWVQNNQDLIEFDGGRFRTGAAFLMPKTGEFSFDMLRWLEGAGLKLPKSYKDMMEEVRFTEGKYVYYAEMEYADERIREAEQRYYEASLARNQQDIDRTWAELQELRERKTEAGRLIRADYPELNVRNFEISLGERQLLVDNEIRPMLDYIFDERGGEVPPEAFNIADALATFDKYKSRIDQIEGSTTAEDQQKRLLKMELDMILRDMGKRDPNTLFFVERILLPMIDSPTYLLRAENAQQQ